MSESIPTVTKDPPVRFPSTWKSAIGKPLTNARITHWAKQGRYGPTMQQTALAKEKRVVRLLDKDSCTLCGRVTKENRYLRYFYLPKSGVYCPVCLATLRQERDKEKEQRTAWRERMLNEYA